MTTLAMPQLDTVEVEHSWVEIGGGVRIHVAAAGAGPPLVLQHGWPQSWWAWNRVIGPLAADHRVICPDLRGFGWSDAPPGRYELGGLASDLLAVLDALGLERVALAGHDWGGYVGFLACLREPRRFSAFVAMSIVHPWLHVPLVPDPRQLARSAYQFVLASPVLGGMLLRRPAVARAFIGRAGAGAWDERSADLYAHALSRPGTAAATVALYRTFLTRELAALRARRYDGLRLETPALMLIGDRDPVIRPPALAGVEQHADAIAIEWLGGAGHWLAEERPDAVVAAIRRRLA